MAKKIFAVEGEWDDNLTHKETIVPILDLMRYVFGVKYVFRKVNSVDSLIKCFKKATLKSMKDYDFIVLAFMVIMSNHFSSCDIGSTPNVLK